MMADGDGIIAMLGPIEQLTAPNDRMGLSIEDRVFELGSVISSNAVTKREARNSLKGP
jgi:hypothetical protein